MDPRLRGDDGSSADGRALHAAAGLLAASVLADSALEHYRGGFENPGMLTPLLTSTAALGAAARGARGAASAGTRRTYAAALLAGLAGTAFHLYNLARRPGGIGWQPLFYGAPLGAPAALSLCGLLGLAAGATRGRTIAALAAGGIAGTSMEAALYHFRGAFHRPAMWLPVTVPPAGAALLAYSAAAPRRAPRRLTRWWLGLTAFLGCAGAAFHAQGVGRQMGGWRNWSQNVQAGPPLPAPPAFSALALAGWAALARMDREAT
ncbi:MAG: hypothetical protein ACXU8N_14730 [Telluria sp.]